MSHATVKVDKRKRILLVKELRELNMEQITAGIHKKEGRQTYENGARMVDVAYWNNYGTKNIPATLFVDRLIKDPIEKRNLLDTIKIELYVLLKYGEQGKLIKASEVVRNIGNYMKGRIQQGIDDKIFLPNAESTIKRKGFDWRLIESGKLYHSIRYGSKKARVEG